MQLAAYRQAVGGRQESTRFAEPSMDTFALSARTALELIVSADRSLWQVVELSLAVSSSACALAAGFGLLAGAWLAAVRFPGRRAVVAGLNTLLALPPVVVGLAVYLLLSRSGPLGELGILFTPSAMVVAQCILVLPIVTALTRQLIGDAMHGNGEQLRSMGASTLACALLLLVHERLALVMILLTAFGRAISEVGAVMIVGGNIDGVTRVMTTTIALETSKGDLPLALGLGIVLLGVVGLINAAIGFAQRWRGHGEGRAA
jgi:ABC-type tungstate transport system substrate-binding protein